MPRMPVPGGAPMGFMPVVPEMEHTWEANCAHEPQLYAYIKAQKEAIQ